MTEVLSDFLNNSILKHLLQHYACSGFVGATQITIFDTSTGIRGKTRGRAPVTGD